MSSPAEESAEAYKKRQKALTKRIEDLLAGLELEVTVGAGFLGELRKQELKCMLSSISVASVLKVKMDD